MSQNIKWWPFQIFKALEYQHIQASTDCVEQLGLINLWFLIKEKKTGLTKIDLGMKNENLSATFELEKKAIVFH